MKRLKKLIAGLSMFAMMFSLSPISASAATLNQDQVKTSLVISDPETGDYWEWDVPISAIFENSSQGTSTLSTFGLDNESNKAEVSVNLGKYLEETFDADTLKSLKKSKNIKSIGKSAGIQNIAQSTNVESIDQSATVRGVGKSSQLVDDITITIGMNYTTKASNNTISVSSVYGSTTPKGLYYASNRKVYWRNPGAGVGSTFKPTSNSWSYSTTSTYGTYSSTVPPYSLLDCEIHVTGMTAYRNVSVMCEIP